MFWLKMADHIGRRQPFGLQAGNVDAHLNLALLAAIRVGRLRARNGGNLGATKY